MRAETIPRVTFSSTMLKVKQLSIFGRMVIERIHSSYNAKYENEMQSPLQSSHHLSANKSVLFVLSSISNNCM